MSRCKELSILLCVTVVLSSFATAIVSAGQSSGQLTSTSLALKGADISLDDPNLILKTITLNPIDTSMPTFVDTGDMIGVGLDAWFAFDLSGLPDSENIVSVTFSAYVYNMSYSTNNMFLYYSSDDSWIFDPDESLSDPGDYIPGEKLIGSISDAEPPESGYVWKTFVVNFDDWTKELADGRMTMMLTSSQSGAVGLTPGTGYSWGVLKAPELTITVIGKEDKVYHDIFKLGPEEIVSTSDSDIDVGTYSVPSLADWNNDGLKDLVVGTGSGNVRVYLNGGSNEAPIFSEKSGQAFYARSGSSDLYCAPQGCMGCFPRVVYWDGDSKKDLLVGLSDGTIKIFRNFLGTDENPIFDYGTNLTVGPEGEETEIDVGDRATPSLVDWNNDGKKDLITGDKDGYIHIFINEGTNDDPVFLTDTLAVKEYGFLLSVPSGRSSPVIFDFNFDGKKDILTGNTNGQLLLALNIGTDESPVFSDFEPVKSNGVDIDLPDMPRSRPFLGYWADDGYPDILIGAYDGKIHLYQCKTLPADFNKDGSIDLKDWAVFANYWKLDKYEDAKTADLNKDGKVDMDDASWITENWLLNIK